MGGGNHAPPCLATWLAEAQRRLATCTCHTHTVHTCLEDPPIVGLLDPRPIVHCPMPGMSYSYSY
eukprot:scaffold221432_cov41-Tisochrysis_lutea.AAC.1